MRGILTITLLLAAAPALLAAQGHDHTPGMQHTPGMDQHAAQAGGGESAGQAAFAAIAAIVARLDADPATDWSRVDIEALRQHLLDMDEVTMRAETRVITLDGGARFEVRGRMARTTAAIRRMLVAHGPTLQRELGYHVTVTEVEEGADMTVLAASQRDARAEARIRGLGLAGLMTLGAHHATHHLAIARGGTPHAQH